MGLWVVTYTERVVCVCTALLFSAYDELVLWYVPPGVIKLPRQVCIAIELSLGSRVNVCELLGLLDVIESTQFSSLPDTLPECTHRAIDYHPGTMEEAI